MTQDQTQHQKHSHEHGEHHKSPSSQAQNSGTKKELGEHAIDSDLKPSAGSEVVDNIESQLENNDSKKHELIAELENSNKAMKAEIEKLKGIASTTQAQYVSLRNEFDNYLKRVDSEKQEMKVAELRRVVTKFSKLLEQIRLYIDHLKKSQTNQEETDAIRLIYESFIGQELAQMGIFQIQSLGLIPDPQLHEILMVQPATQDDLTRLQDNSILLDGEKTQYQLEELVWHCITELEVWYYYFDGEKKIVIKPSKVIVAQ